MGPHIAETGLELSMQLGITLNRSSCLYHPSAGITGVCHCTWPGNSAQVEDAHALRSFFLSIGFLSMLLFFLTPNAAKRHPYLS